MIRFNDIKVKFQVVIKSSSGKVVEAMYFDSSPVAKAFAADYNAEEGGLPTERYDYG